MAVPFPRLSSWLVRRRAALLKGTLRIVVVALLVGTVAALLAPSTYRIAQGDVTFQISPAWPGGRLIMPLGPAGVLELKTHHTPFDLKMGLTLADQVPSVSEARALLDGLPGLKTDASAAFSSFLLGKLPWLLALGALAGLLVANGGRRWLRRSLLHAAAGAVVLAAATGLVLGFTALTLNHSPRVEYQGLATQLPRVMAMVRGVAADQSTRGRSIRDFVRGMEEVATQLYTGTAPAVPTTRLLAVSDVHDNLIGMRLAYGLAHSSTTPVSATLLAGDLTNRGSDVEARLFVSMLETGRVPVLAVGGNHEDEPAMRDFARAGYQVLDWSFATAGGVAVYGVSDPLSRVLAATPDEAALKQQDATLLERWKTFSPAPQILLVHDLTQVLDVVSYARDHHQSLTVIHGHDHVASVRREGSVTIVDTGTGGGGGYGEIGARPSSEYTFQLLDFSQGADPRLLGVTTMRYTGLQGKSSAEFTPLGQ